MNADQSNLDTSVVLSPKPAAKRWYMQLWVQVLVAMGLGVAIGQYFPNAGQSLQPLGDASARTTVPLFSSRQYNIPSAALSAPLPRAFFSLQTSLPRMNSWHIQPEPSE